MTLPQGRYVLSEIFVIVRRFSQKLQAHKLNMIKRGKQARHPRTRWRIWACDVTPTLRIGMNAWSTYRASSRCWLCWQLSNFCIVGLNMHRAGGTDWGKTKFRFGNIVPKQWTLSGFVQHTTVLTQCTKTITRLVGNKKYCIWIKCLNVCHIFKRVLA